jgi:hypothetical protein
VRIFKKVKYLVRIFKKVKYLVRIFKKVKYLVPLANRKNNFSEEIARFICKTKLPDISRGKNLQQLLGIGQH